MKHDSAHLVPPSEEVRQLVETLRQSEARLAELTLGEIDTVVSEDGTTFLLQKAQRDLRESDSAREAAILNALPAHIALLNSRGVIVSVNEAWRRFDAVCAVQGTCFTVGTDYLAKCESAELDGAKEAQAVAAGVRAVLDGTALSYAGDYECSSPEAMWFQFTVTPLSDDRRNGVALMHVDITATKRAEADLAKQNERLEEHAKALLAQTDQLRDQELALRAEVQIRVAQTRDLATAEETLRTLIEGLDVGVMFLGEDGAVNEYNASALRILGLESAEISARTLDGWDAIREDGSSYSAAELPASITLATGKPQAGEVMGIARPDGSRAWIAANTRRVEYGPTKKCGVVESFADITDRREAEIALDRQREFLKALLENLSDAIVACDADGILTYFNSATTRIHGLPAAPLPPEEWASRYSLYDADGKTPLAREEIPLFRALNGEAVRNVEFVIAPAGRVTNRLLASGTAIHDAGGKKIGAVVVMRDITDLSAAQQALEHSSAQLRQAQKMEAVGRLAGGVAHDFNNLLTAITSYAQFVLDDTAPDDPRREDIEEIRAASDRAAALTRQLLAFSRRQVLHIRTMDPNASIASAERLLGRVIGEGVQIKLRLDPGAWAISCDPGQFEQVIFNLAINARDAMPSGGALVIETRNVELDAAAVEQEAGVVPGRYLELTVCDTGVGMDAETASKIFEPFFTTKGVGKGTGLGLSTVYGIVTQCGGKVTVHSEPGVGTTFRILLPAASPDSVVIPAGERTAVGGRGTETILLVEDDLTIRRVVERILKANGYTTVVAQDGAAALRIVRDRGQAIDMLITDMVMPGMGGREVVETLRSSNPEIRALIISGYSAEAYGAEGAPLPGIAFLDKPFTAQQLITRIREVLDKPIAAEMRDFLHAVA